MGDTGVHLYFVNNGEEYTGEQPRCDRQWCVDTQLRHGIIIGRSWGTAPPEVQHAWELVRACERPNAQQNMGCTSTESIVQDLLRRGKQILAAASVPMKDKATAAEAVYATALQLDPKAHEAMHGRAHALEGLHRWADAKAQYEQLSLLPTPDGNMRTARVAVAARIEALRGMIRTHGRIQTTEVPPLLNADAFQS